MPTLNRGRYVVRAVESCLNARRSDIDVEVVVLDSESDDGSWESLQARFAHDDRVLLAQNRRGLGPTRSWLDGARLARGDYLTFIWSDDYISPHFLSILVPPLRDGSAVAVGKGVIRALDDETPLPSDNRAACYDPVTFLDGYFKHGLKDGVFRPVSPACSLFSRAAFDRWMTLAEAWCQATPLRRELHWRRAIGPDLLLFLVAIHMTPKAVFVSCDTTAQFSHHPDSFSVAASRWSYEAGYWLARLWYPHHCGVDRQYTAEAFASHSGAIFVTGFVLAAKALLSGTRTGFRNALAIGEEIGQLWPVVVRRRTCCRVIIETPCEFCRRLGRLVFRAQQGS